MAEFRIVLDMRALQALERRLPGAMDQAVRKIAIDVQADVQTHFSTKSPSDPGTPPGVRTGNLKNSITVQREGELSYSVNVGAAYGVHLEFRRKASGRRPFLKPALQRQAQRIPDTLKAKFKEILK